MRANKGGYIVHREYVLDRARAAAALLVLRGADGGNPHAPEGGSRAAVGGGDGSAEHPRLR